MRVKQANKTVSDLSVSIQSDAPYYWIDLAMQRVPVEWITENRRQCQDFTSNHYITSGTVALELIKQPEYLLLQKFATREWDMHTGTTLTRHKPSL